jgi:hypothetical protein
MKQTIFITLLLCSIIAQAQQKSNTSTSSATGRWFVGNASTMSFGYSSHENILRDNIAQSTIDGSKETGLLLYLPFQARLGSLQIGGSKTTYTGNKNVYKQNNGSIFLNPEIGKHFTDKISAGIVFQLSLSRQKSNDEQASGNQLTIYEQTTKGGSFGVAPFIQYFFKGRDKKWSPYVILRPGIAFDKTTSKSIIKQNNVLSDNYKGTNKYSYRQVRSAIGLQKMLGKHFSFDVSFGYEYVSNKSTTITDYANQADVDYRGNGKTHQIAFETGLRYMF